MSNNQSLKKYKRNLDQNESEFFKKITRLFSGPIANYQRQFPYKSKKQDLYKYNFKNADGSVFRKSVNPIRLMMNAQVSYSEISRIDRYLDYNQMEFDAYMATALDIYANEITTHSILDPLLTVECPNDHIKEILTDLFYNVLNIEYNLRPWVREVCKYGDNFLYIDSKEGEGIKSVIQLPPDQVERMEGLDENNPNYVQFQWNAGSLTLESPQICHFRIPGNGKFFPYGTSVLEPCRRVWRQLELMINHMIAYRVIRSGDKKVFYLQVGHIHPDDVEQYVEKTMSTMKRSEILDPDAKTVDKRYSPFGVEEDYVIPVRGDLSSKIDNITANTNSTAIEDIQFLREILFAALKIPQSYLSRTGEGGGSEDQGSLAQKNITFANTIGVIQQHIIEELNKLAIIHLYALGFRGKDLLSHKLKLANSSKLAHTQELQNFKIKMEIAQSAEKLVNRRWTAEKVLGFTGEEYKRNLIEKFSDAKFDAMIASIGKNAENGMGDEFGGDLGTVMPNPDDMDLGMSGDLGGGGDVGEMETPEQNEDKEDVLLAAPGYRLTNKKSAQLRGDDYVTKGSKGKAYRARGVSSTRGIAQSHRADADPMKYTGRTAGIMKENIDKDLEELEYINRYLIKE